MMKGKHSIRNRLALLLQVSIVLMLIGFAITNSVEACNVYIPVEDIDQMQREKIVDKFEKQGVRYKLEDEKLMVCNVDAEAALITMREILYDDLPPEYSFSPSSKALGECIIEKLKEAGVAYRLREVNEQSWIITEGEKPEPFIFSCSEYLE